MRTSTNSERLHGMHTENPFLFYDLAPDVVAFSTNRHGGISKGDYATFNVNAWCGDSPDNVRANREVLCKALRLEKDRLVMPHQIHGTETRLIASEFFSLRDDVRQMLLEGVDAVITKETEVCIGVSTADCIPVLLYDAGSHACAAIHAGWRGTVARIVQRAIAEMKLAFGSEPQQLQAVIGPGISLEAFEVGQEVYDSFAEAGFCMDDIARMYDKWHIDLPLCNRMQLMEAGLREENIQTAAICTYQNHKDYFSARRLGVNSGRMLTGIMLRNTDKT